MIDFKYEVRIFIGFGERRNGLGDEGADGGNDPQNFGLGLEPPLHSDVYVCNFSHQSFPVLPLRNISDYLKPCFNSKTYFH